MYQRVVHPVKNNEFVCITRLRPCYANKLYRKGISVLSPQQILISRNKILPTQQRQKDPLRRVYWFTRHRKALRDGRCCIERAIACLRCLDRTGASRHQRHGRATDSADGRRLAGKADRQP